MTSKNTILILALTMMFGLSGCFESSTEDSPPALLDPTDKPVSSQGQELYDQYCAACHPVSASLANRTAEQINTAIAGVDSMNSITLTANELQFIVDFLAGGGGTPPPVPTDGEGLYNTFCITCHSDASALAQRSVTQIETAIANVPTMQSISLDEFF